MIFRACSRDVSPCYLVSRCPFSRCQPLLPGLAMSFLAMSFLAFSVAPFISPWLRSWLVDCNRFRFQVNKQCRAREPLYSCLMFTFNSQLRCRGRGRATWQHLLSRRTRAQRCASSWSSRGCRLAQQKRLSRTRRGGTN